MKLLVVEDDIRIADIIRRALTESGYAVDARHNAQAAIDAFDIYSYDLILLDILLPGLDGGGIEVCRHIRAINSHVPILMLTALDGPQNIADGLDSGADDYLVKPFRIIELLARVRALLRRAPHADNAQIRVRDIVLLPATRQVRRGDRLIELTAKEYAVLEYMLRNAGQIVSQSELIEHAWDSNYDGTSNVVETYVRYLRKKLNAHGEADLIETQRGFGYIIRDKRPIGEHQP